MAQIDVELPDNLQRFLEQPRCADISLPEPGSVKIQLPNGGTIKGIADVTKGIPTDCSLSFSLLVQLGAILVPLECLVRVVGIIKPLIDIVNGLPFPPAKAIADFGEAAAKLAECIVAFTPAGLIPFIKDILCLVIKVLNCLIQQLASILSVLDNLSLQITQAEADGNDELLANLQCAQENTNTSALAAMQSVEPVIVILELVGPLMEVAGVGPVEIPTFGDTERVEQMQERVGLMEDFVDTLQLVADGLGGCA